MEKRYREETYMRNKYVRITAAILAICWMIVIFAFSAEEKEESGAASRGVSYRIVASADSLLGLNMGDTKIMEVAGRIEGVVRKIAHMIEYGILAALIGVTLDAWVPDRKMLWIRLIISLVFSAVYGATDEIHQLYVPGRNGSFRDVGIDSFGALLSLALITFVWCTVNRIKQKKLYVE